MTFPIMRKQNHICIKIEELIFTVLTKGTDVDELNVVLTDCKEFSDCFDKQ